MDREFIVSVEDIFFTDKQSSYHIPPSQRGYKWTYNEVKTLLNDVDKFIPAGNKFYCLQNITLVSTNEQDCYNVVDGQQRLTTLQILLSYFFRNEQDNIKLLQDRLSYEVRKETEKFIKDAVCAEGYWEDLKTKRQEKSDETVENLFREIYKDTDYDHRDIYHIFAASLAIVDFFKDSKKENDLHEKFLKHVKLIKNVLWQADESKIFNKVNGYKVPLDAADLIRAILITRVPIKQDKGFFSLDFLVSLNEKRTRIGLELDAINNWWQDSNRMKFFRRFIPNNFLNDNGKNLFQHEIYPLDILYILYAIICGEKKLSSLEFFEEKTANESVAFSTYQEILHTQRILQEWYDDTEIYHLIGVLWFFRNAQEQRDKILLIKELHDQWQRKDVKNRSEFIKYLKSELRKSFTKTIIDSEKKQKRVPDLKLWLDRIDNAKNENYDWYNDKNGMLQKVLILTDVILHIQDGKFGYQKFEKMAVTHFYTRGQGRDLYDGIQEDKEHIFPQTPVNKEFCDNFKEYWTICLPHAIEKRNANMDLDEEWKKYFKDVAKTLGEEKLLQLRNEWRNYLQIENLDTDFIPDLRVVASDPKNINRTLIELLQPLVNKFVFEITGIYINSIGNIVLLSSGVNRSYGNDFFPKKRCEILKQFNKGDFIRLHTRQVFAKEGIGYSQEYNEWGKEDVIATAQNIRTLIEDFFKGTDMSEDEIKYQETAEDSNEKDTDNDAE